MLQPIADDLFSADHQQRMPGGVWFPSRMGVVRLPGGRIALWSPVPIDDALAEEIDALGEVAFLIAPNLFHNLHMPAAAARYPAARIVAPPGFDAKRPELDVDATLGTGPSPFDDSLIPLLVEGAPSVNEVVLHHPPSGTLLVADLVFHMHEPKNFMTSLVLWLTGTKGRFAMSRSWRAFVKSRPAAAASLRRMLEWEFDRVVMGHGAILDHDGHARMEEVTSWLRGPAPALLPSSAL